MHINVRPASVQSHNEKATAVSYTIWGTEPDILREIVSEVIPEWAEKYDEYVKSFSNISELGSTAEYADLFRSVEMIKPYYWESQKMEEHVVDIVLWDTLTSVLNLIALRARERPEPEELPAYVNDPEDDEVENPPREPVWEANDGDNGDDQG